MQGTEIERRFAALDADEKMEKFVGFAYNF